MIDIHHVSKTFIIPHEARTTLKEHAINLFRPTTYERFSALHDVTFTIPAGEWVGIIGRNGSGKSTLLRIVAGVYAPDTGDVSVEGRVLPLLGLGLGFNPELSARDNIFLNGVLLGMTRKEIDRKFDYILSFAELERFVDTKLKNFSSGMQLRLAFSVAAAAVGDVYLLDEVLAVGDLSFQSKVHKTFHDLKKRGKTVLLVSHNLQEIESWCDRAIYLEQGRVAADGKTGKVISRFRHRILETTSG
jgi:lipopolysaccharide transport system ATP-binding protein